MLIQMSPRGFSHVMFRHHRLFVLCCLWMLIIAVVYCIFAQPIYRSQAALVVKFENGSRDNVPDVAISAQAAERREVVNTNVRLLTSADLILDLLHHIDVAKLYPRLARSNSGDVPLIDRAHIAFLRDLGVNPVRDSDVIEVSLDNPDPAVAAASLTEYVNLFVDRETKLYRNIAFGLMSEQAEQARRRLRQSQAALDAFLGKFGISSLEDERTALLKLQMDTRSALGEQQAKLGEGQGRRTAVSASLATLKPQIELSDENDRYKAVDDARTRLADLVARRAELHNYQPNSQTLRAFDAQIDSAQKELGAATAVSAARVRMGPNPVYQQAQTDLIKAEQDINSARGAIIPLQDQLRKIDERLGELSSREAEYHTLTLQQQTDEESYRTFLQRRDDARVADALNQQKINGIAVLQSATVPVTPVRPRVGLVLGLAFVLGSVVGVAACFILETVDETFSRPLQVEPVLGLPVLAAFSADHTLQRRQGQLA